MKKLLKNSLFGLLQFAIVTPIFLLITPYVLNELGADRYGIWALTSVIGSYKIFIDMGFSMSLVRFFSKADTLNDRILLSKYANTSLVFFVLILTPVLLVIFFLRHPIANILFNKETLNPIVPFLITVAAISSAINLVSSVFKSILDGIQKIYISNVILIVQAITISIGMYIFIKLGYGLWGLGINLIINSLLILILNLSFSIYYTKVRFGFLYVKFHIFKELFKYSFNVQVGSVSRMVIDPINKIIISFLFPISYVGYYDIATKISARALAAINNIIIPVFPFVTEIYYKEGINQANAFRISLTKILFKYGSVFNIFLIFIVLDFVPIWLGKPGIIISYMAVFFLISNLSVILTIPHYAVFLASGNVSIISKTQILYIIFNLLASLVLGYLMGIYGFCLGTTLAFIFIFFLYMIGYKKTYGIRFNLKDIFLNNGIVTIPIVIIILVLLRHFNVTNYYNLLTKTIVEIVCIALVLFVIDRKNLYKLFRNLKKEIKK